MMADNQVVEAMMLKFFKFRLALLVALLMPSLAFAQRPLPDQTTVDNSQQITVYDSTRPARDRNLRITVGLLRGNLPATIEPSQCVQGNGGGTELVFGPCGAPGATSFLGLSDVAATSIVNGQCVAGNSAGMLVFAACGGGGTADGVLTGGSVSGGTATFTRSIGQDIDVTGFFTAADVPPFALFEEGIELTSNLQGINFRGFEVVVLDTPQSIANIRFGSILQDEGTELSEDGAHIVNYTGAGVTSSFNNTTNALTVNVPGAAGALTADADSGLFISGGTIAFQPSRLIRIPGSETASRSDDLILKNESDGNHPGLMSVQNFLTSIAGDNLSVDGDGRQLNAAAGRWRARFAEFIRDRRAAAQPHIRPLARPRSYYGFGSASDCNLGGFQ